MGVCICLGVGILAQGSRELGTMKDSSVPMDVPLDVYMRALASPTVAVLEEILADISWRNDKARVAPAAEGASDNVPVLRMTLGLVSARHAGSALSLETAKRPRLCNFLAKLLEVQCSGARATEVESPTEGSHQGPAHHPRPISKQNKKQKHPRKHSRESKTCQKQIVCPYVGMRKGCPCACRRLAARCSSEGPRQPPQNPNILAKPKL